MLNTENTCLKGNNSTLQATDSPRKGLPELTTLISELRFWGQDAPDFKQIFQEMFLEALPGRDGTQEQEVLENYVWCYRQINQLLDLLEQLQEFHPQIQAMKQSLSNVNQN